MCLIWSTIKFKRKINYVIFRKRVRFLMLFFAFLACVFIVFIVFSFNWSFLFLFLLNNEERRLFNKNTYIFMPSSTIYDYCEKISTIFMEWRWGLSHRIATNAYYQINNEKKVRLSWWKIFFRRKLKISLSPKIDDDNKNIKKPSKMNFRFFFHTKRRNLFENYENHLPRSLNSREEKKALKT